MASDDTVAVLTKLAGCEIYQVFYESVLRVCFSFMNVLFESASSGYLASYCQLLRYWDTKHNWGCSSLLIITLMKLKGKCSSSYLCDFNFSIQLQQLFAVGSSGFLSGFVSMPIKKSMHYYVVQKTLINTWYWFVTITPSKCYGICVRCLYTVEWKSLHVNTSYFVTEYFCILTRRSPSLKTIYNINVFSD
jgi:hypothetical protein